MYTIGSLSDLISGSDTPNKLAVKVKEVQYKKPIIKKSKPFKKPDNPAPKEEKFQKNEKQDKSEKPVFNKTINAKKFDKTAQKNIKFERKGNAKYKRTNMGKNLDKPARKEVKLQENINKTSQETTKQSTDAILKDKKLNNAEKRVIIKRKASNSETPKKYKPKKPKLQNKSNSDDKSADDRTIFVGNVPLNSETQDIKKIFSKYGPIESVRFRGIPTADLKTPKKVALLKKQFHPKRKSMLAYVVFKKEQDAINAKNSNGEVLNSFHLQVDYLNDDTDHDKKKCVFLGNLPLDAAEEDIRQIFEVCGSIKNVRIIRDQTTNVGKGFGFVNFNSADATEFALQLENVVLGKRTIRIQRCSIPGDKNKKKTADGKKIRERYAIHINNLPKSATETEIREIFKKCGDIISVRMSPGTLKGKFCYINFQSYKAVEKAVNMKNPTLRNTILKINECKPKINVQKTEKKMYPSIYVSQLPLKTNQEDLVELFVDCGTVMFARVFRKKFKDSGVGFVNFDTEEAVEKALKKKIKIEKNEIIISRKRSKSEIVEQNKKKDEDAETSGEEENDEDAPESAEEEESDADEELIREINGTKKWEDESESSNSDGDDVSGEDADDDDENEEDDDDGNEEDDDDDNTDNNEENETAEQADEESDAEDNEQDDDGNDEDSDDDDDNDDDDDDDDDDDNDDEN